MRISRRLHIAVPETARDLLVHSSSTALPVLPHAHRVVRLYRQWLKLALLFPHSNLVDVNEHTQMNERALVIIRQRFREGMEIKDPDRIQVLLHEAERSLTMLRELSQDCALRRFPQQKHPDNFFGSTSTWELVKKNYVIYFKECINRLVKRKW